MTCALQSPDELVSMSSWILQCTPKVYFLLTTHRLIWFPFVCLFCFLNMPHVAQSGLELLIFLPPPPKYWIYKCGQSINSSFLTSFSLKGLSRLLFCCCEDTMTKGSYRRVYLSLWFQRVQIHAQHGSRKHDTGTVTDNLHSYLQVGGRES